MSPLLWPDPTPPAMPGDDTPETRSLAPSSPARAWGERRLRGCAWAAAQDEDTLALAHCPARDSRGPASKTLDDGPMAPQGGGAVVSARSRDDPIAAIAPIRSADPRPLLPTGFSHERVPGLVRCGLGCGRSGQPRPPSQSPPSERPSVDPLPLPAAGISHRERAAAPRARVDPTRAEEQ
jgi:hypothetical protein